MCFVAFCSVVFDMLCFFVCVLSVFYFVVLYWFTKSDFAQIKKTRFTKTGIPSRGLRSHNSELVEFQVPPHP